MMVQAISSGALWVVRDGVGLDRELNRTITMPSKIKTNTAIALVIQNKNVLKPVMSSMIGVAESWKPICHGTGCPSAANAAPPLQTNIPKISAVALNRDSPSILSAPRSAPTRFEGAVTAPANRCILNTCFIPAGNS